MKTALVCGAGGFIGSHMVKRLKKEGYWVRGVDLKRPEYSETEADHFVVGDLRNPELVSRVTFAPNQSDIYSGHGSFDLVIQMAADMAADKRSATSKTSTANTLTMQTCNLATGFVSFLSIKPCPSCPSF